MRKLISVGLLFLGLIVAVPTSVFALSIFQYSQGGTGQISYTTGQLIYSGSSSFQNVATTSVTCSGNTSCSTFTAIGSSPVTISSSGGASTTLLSDSNTFSGHNTFAGLTVSGSYTQVGTATNNINGPIKFGNGAYFIGNSVNGFVINNNSDTLNLVQFYPSGGGAIGSDYSNNGSDPGTNNFIVEGKIGIGTTTPSQMLSVQGNELLSGNFSGSNINATGTLTLLALTGTQCLHEISGVVSGTGSDCGSSSGSAYPFTPSTFGINVSATSTPLYPSGLITGTSTIGTLVASSSITNQAVKSALVLDSSTGLEGAYGGAAGCTNQFVTAISAVGGTTCTSITSSNVTTALGFTPFGGTNPLPIANGGTGQTSASAAFNALSPLTTSGDMLYGGASGAGTRLAIGTPGFILASLNGIPTWVASTTISNISAFKQASNYATTGALPANTYLSGVLTEVGTGALTVDGASPSIGQRILVKNEATQTNNGIYTVTATGSGIAAYVLTRATDFNTSDEIYPGVATYILTGTANGDTTWVVTSTPPVVLDTTNLTFVESANGNITLPISVANGGTGATSFTTTGNSVYWDGSKLATALTTASVTTPFASSTSITSSQGAWFATVSGNVGVGTTSPSKLFTVEGNQSGGVARIQRDFTSSTGQSVGTYDVLLNELNASLQDQTGPAQTFGASASGGAENIYSSITSARDGADTSGNFYIQTYNLGTPTNALGITHAQYVGIASTTPFSRLSIGTGLASSSITVAEYKYGATGNVATSTTQNIDCNASTQIAEPIGTSATTLTLINLIPGKKCIVVVQNPNNTAGAITWRVESNAILKWAGGTIPTQTTTANTFDIWSFLATQGSSTMEIIGAATLNN